jgi:Domain of unknown function (DUF397)
LTSANVTVVLMQPYATPDQREPFLRSSFCQGGMCVEVAQSGDEILMRDGKDVSVAPLRFSKEEWRQFVAQCREG